MGQLFANAARAYLSAGINDTNTSIGIAAGGGLFPVANGTDWFKAVLQDAAGIEIVYVTAHASASTSFTVTRGQEGTTARAFAAGSVFGLRVTAADTAAFAAKLGDAPSDGKTYGRKDAGWEEVTASVNEIRTPVNVSPAEAATDVMDTDTLDGSPYYSLYGVAMTASQWQVSTSSSFTTTAISTGDIAGTDTQYTMPAAALTVSTVYYWRVRYKNAEGVYSEWSAPTSFTTSAFFNSYITTPTATPSNFGDAFEGGFYAGLIWNEISQSTTSTLIGTGTKAFTVADMSGAPIVYPGQTLEVRSRANPANSMKGTVLGAAGTTLTLDITSVGGGGTFTDWSIMSRYRVIAAPKASGENASIQWKNANTAAPAATATLSEGRKSTLAMVAADTSTVYPAAHWCNNLNIGGRTDWYLPARDELELLHRNLKPVTNNNSVVTRPNSPTTSYQNLGSFSDASTANGTNRHSDPVGAAYTTTVPAQTTPVAFRTGGAEALLADAGTSKYYSSSEYSTTSIWSHGYLTGSFGEQSVNTKGTSFRIRAVRRSII